VRLAAYAVVLAAIIVLVLPTSRAGRAVTSVTDSLSGVLRS
jgi:hypothetical protein